eukprot:9443764-Pyramimonas_sp.AAC.1
MAETWWSSIGALRMLAFILDTVAARIVSELVFSIPVPVSTDWGCTRVISRGPEKGGCVLTTPSKMGR